MGGRGVKRKGSLGRPNNFLSPIGSETVWNMLYVFVVLRIVMGM